MLVSVRWRPSGTQAALPAEFEVPDEVEDDYVIAHLEENTAGTVEEWKPLTRRRDPASPQPLTCPNCASERFDEVGYVDYRARGVASADGAGIQFAHAGAVSRGENYHPIALECAECETCVQTLAGEPFERPDPDQLRVRLAHARQGLAQEEQERPPRDALDHENGAGVMPNLEALGSVEAYDAGVEAGIELATGAALRVACGTRAYIARGDWRLALLNFARTVLDEEGARLIALRAGGKIDVASRLYPASAYESSRRLMEVACARQTQVLNETEGNVYVARRYADGVVIYTARDCILLDECDSAAATAIPRSAPSQRARAPRRRLTS